MGEMTLLSNRLFANNEEEIAKNVKNPVVVETAVAGSEQQVYEFIDARDDVC